ncbi:MAG: hypothetical protein WDZ48_10965 [Pirellulales bacterium]
MSRFAALALCVAFSCCTLLVLASPGWAADPAAEATDGDPFGESANDAAAARSVPAAAPTNGNPSARAEAKIRAALDDQTKVEVIETPLQEVVTYLRDLHGILIQFDKKALEDAGSDPESIVTLSANGISLDSVLHHMLSQLDMTFVIRDGVLLITSTDAAEKMVELRVYNAGELVGSSANVRELAETLRSIFKDNFDAVPFYNFLIVQASQHGHEELTRLLDQMKDKVIVDPLPTKP